VQAVLWAGCYLAGGWEPALSGLRALREPRLDVDLLMVAAAAAAAAIGQVVDGGLLIVIFATSGAFEALATRRTRDSVAALLDLAPEEATRLGAGGEERVRTESLAVGDRVLVRPGERIGADGVVLDGDSEVDQQSITGEAAAAPKRPGEEVFSGTLNGSGALVVRVSRAAADSVVARIAALVDQAAATKARTQLLVERVEQRYSVGMVAATVLLVALPLALGDEPFREVLVRAMTFMIVASPCAVVLATMPPLLSAIATAGRNGLLVKDAVALERMAGVSVAVLDKTGTLTEGRPRVAAVHPLGPERADEVLAMAAAVESASEHPLGRAVVRAAADRGLAVPAAAGVHALPGRGVTGSVGGRTVSVLAVPPTYCADLEVAQASSGAAPGATSGSAGDPAGWREAAYTVSVVECDGAAVGLLAFSDSVRPEAPAAVAALARITAARPVLLTGDRPGPAEAVAAAVGVADVRSGLLPEGKVDAVRALQEAGHRVLAVGDGVNDAPALAAADCGLAMGGSGADLSLQTADAVLVRDDLRAAAAGVRLARRARRLVAQNLAIAFTAIAVLVALDLAGRLPLPLGVAGHEGSTVLVALNGLRLLRRGAWQAA
jgi:heavy metal translocating P-type ATPase